MPYLGRKASYSSGSLSVVEKTLIDAKFEGVMIWQDMSWLSLTDMTSDVVVPSKRCCFEPQEKSRSKQSRVQGTARYKLQLILAI